MDYLPIGLTIAFAVLYYGAAEAEARSSGRHFGVLWALSSILVSALVFAVLGGGTLLLLLAQGGLFVAIGAIRVWLEGRTGSHR